MKLMWCWRCRRDVPMLDEDEFAAVERTYVEASQNSIDGQRSRQVFLAAGVPLPERWVPERNLYSEAGWQTAKAEYERRTGETETSGHVMRHRISLYGPLCLGCGKPLRTPQAKLCAACWTRITDVQEAPPGKAGNTVAYETPPH